MPPQKNPPYFNSRTNFALAHCAVLFLELFRFFLAGFSFSVFLFSGEVRFLDCLKRVFRFIAIKL